MFRRSPKNQLSRLLRLPQKGRLLICTDLHGNLRDFRRMRDLFMEADQRGEQPFLLFTGDLIHGPNCEEEEWPEYLGSYFPDESPKIVEGFIQLKKQYPDRVACLLGNHEHSHVGGPHTPKFWPDETLHFEQTVGIRLAKRYQKLFMTFPAVAVASCGVVVTHAAPHAEISGPEDIANLNYQGFEWIQINAIEQLPLLGRLLWSRSCPPDVARRFLAALGKGGQPLNLVVFGHEIESEGFRRIGDEQLLLSTSFGVPNEKKTYLSLDLSSSYASTTDLREGVELIKLD